ncbi:monooxygenase [Immersiella caudata]|uniref:Monooxygenase n=1 Tax=Immersiella caudata TaxID=314043 RepID=A0AA39U618_9PEZI|nr:monooxygenase [Immersiella caudata]
MKFLLLATLATAALALPSDPLSARQKKTCTNPKLRKDWAKATNAEKKSYIDAVLCLATKPSRLKVPTHSTLYDDFAWVHAKLTDPQRIHAEPVFLPWHRYFVQVYEDALHSCGYTGAAMYWDWTADWAAPSKAAVWNPVLGFGGNGSDSADGNGPLKLRIADGPFRNLRPTYWNGDVDPHWLSRDWAPAYPGQPELIGNAYSPSIMEEVFSWTEYERFWPALESSPHGGLHAGVGGGRGDMGPTSSPNDPIFFLHHAMVDKLWWEWQRADRDNRINAYKGMRNDGQEASLEDMMPMLKLAPDAKVKDYIDTEGGALCYKY